MSKTNGKLSAYNWPQAVWDTAEWPGKHIIVVVVVQVEWTIIINCNKFHARTIYMHSKKGILWKDNTIFVWFPSTYYLAERT